MTLLYDQIKLALEAAFNPVVLELENESHLHKTFPGAETHFKCLIVSAEFEAFSSVKRHQAVFHAIEFARHQGLHAFALNTFTPREWPDNSHLSFNSPKCQHQP